MRQTQAIPASPHQKGAVVSKAVLRCAERLGVSKRLLGRVIGLSEASVSRMMRGERTFSLGEKSYELSLLFIRLFHSLDSIVGGDEAAARDWLRNRNLALGSKPIALIETEPGLINVLHYLDSERTTN